MDEFAVDRDTLEIEGGIMDALEQSSGDGKQIKWMPKWIVKMKPNNIGITIDDHCYLVLVRKEGGQWMPTKWIPKEAVIFIAELIKTNV